MVAAAFTVEDLTERLKQTEGEQDKALAALRKIARLPTYKSEGAHTHFMEIAEARDIARVVLAEKALQGAAAERLTNKNAKLPTS